MYFCKQCQEVRKLTVEGPFFLFFLLNQSPYVQSLVHRLRKTVVWVRLPVNNRPNMYIRKKSHYLVAMKKISTKFALVCMMIKIYNKRGQLIDIQAASKRQKQDPIDISRRSCNQKSFHQS